MTKLEAIEKIIEKLNFEKMLKEDFRERSNNATDSVLKARDKEASYRHFLQEQAYTEALVIIASIDCNN